MQKEKKYWLRLTRTCNNRCVFCLDSQTQNGTSYSLQYLKGKIRKGYDSQFRGKQRLILSGGEPTINPYYIEVIKYGKQFGFDKIQTITNGRMFYYKKFINQAKQAGLDETTFSLHGHNSELHDSLTGIKGSFTQALAGLQNALNLGLIVNIDIVINKKNCNQLLAIIKFFHSFGVEEFDLLTIMPYGRAWGENFAQLFYDLTDFQPIFEQVLNYGKKNNLVIWCNRFPVNYFENKEYLLRDIEKKLYSEILGEREKGFDRFLTQGKKMKCFDWKRCQYCFIKDFCNQLFYFNNLIGNGQSEIEIFSRPFCLSDDNYKKVKLGELLKENRLDLKKFFDFYLANLHHYKSLRCYDCIYFNKCRGLAYEDIIKDGFKQLKPIL